MSDYDDLMAYLETLPATRDPECSGTAADIVRGRISTICEERNADVALLHERIAELERELLEARCELADARKEVNYRVRSEENALSVADRENARLHELERRIEIKTEEANRYLVERDALREAWNLYFISSEEQEAAVRSVGREIAEEKARTAIYAPRGTSSNPVQEKVAP